MKITDQIYAFPWQSMVANNCNTYLINGPERVLIDPGHLAHFDHVEKGLNAIGLELNDIGHVICTHAHPDHIEAVQLFKKSNAKFAMHREEWHLAKSMEKFLIASGVDVNDFMPDVFIEEGEFPIGNIGLKIFHTPGHSPGSISIYWPEEKALFTGDLIFQDGLGRTDLPGGNSQELKESINRISTLPADYLFSGHGNIITNGGDVRGNFEHVKNVWFNYL